jgi:hypothetical protein
MRHRDRQRVIARSPRSTTISGFYDGLGGRDPGAWPSLLRRSWEERFGQTQPYPFGAPLGDNPQNRGARASQYSS